MILSSLNRSIVIEERTVEKVNGFEKESWTYFKKIFCSVRSLTGKESFYFKAKEIGSSITLEFATNYLDSLESLNSKDFRIKFNNEFFNITDIDNYKFENRILIIKAEKII